MYRNFSFLRAVGVILMLVIIGGTMLFEISTQTRQVERCSAVTTGVVTSYTAKRRRHNHRNSSTTGVIEVDYEVNGISYSCQGATGGHKEIGAHVDVHYNPSDPSDAFADKSPVLNKSLLYISIAAGSVVFIVISVIDRSKNSYKY